MIPWIIYPYIGYIIHDNSEIQHEKFSPLFPPFGGINAMYVCDLLHSILHCQLQVGLDIYQCEVCVGRHQNFMVAAKQHP